MGHGQSYAGNCSPSADASDKTAPMLSADGRNLAPPILQGHIYWGLYWDNGKENGNYYNINGNYYNIFDKY